MLINMKIVILQIFKNLLPSHLEIINLTNLWLNRKNDNRISLI